MTKVYTTSNCPRCEKLKNYLNKKDIEYIEKDMATPETRTELAMDDVFAKSAPILRTPKENYYKLNQLFKEDSLKKQELNQIIQEEINPNE